MDRHRHSRLEQSGRTGGAGGVQVAAPEPRAPPPDREQRNVEAAGGRAQRLEQFGVARKEDSLRTFDKIGQRLARARERMASAVVLEAGGGYVSSADTQSLPWYDLGDFPKAGALEESTTAARRQHRAGT